MHVAENRFLRDYNLKAIRGEIALIPFIESLGNSVCNPCICRSVVCYFLYFVSNFVAAVFNISCVHSKHEKDVVLFEYLVWVSNDQKTESRGCNVNFQETRGCSDSGQES